MDCNCVRKNEEYGWSKTNEKKGTIRLEWTRDMISIKQTKEVWAEWNTQRMWPSLSKKDERRKKLENVYLAQIAFWSKNISQGIFNDRCASATTVVKLLISKTKLFLRNMITHVCNISCRKISYFS
jgi:hypothetical protein